MTVVCFVGAWTTVVLVLWSMGASIREAIGTTKKLHKIPCSQCQFYTKSHYLKCPVHPGKALTEDAINCPDFGLSNGL